MLWPKYQHFNAILNAIGQNDLRSLSKQNKEKQKRKVKEEKRKTAIQTLVHLSGCRKAIFNIKRKIHALETIRTRE